MATPRFDKVLWSAVGATVLVGLGITAALVLRAGGRGAVSRDELVRRAFAAVTSGDVDELARLASYDAVKKKLMSCDAGVGYAGSRHDVDRRMRDAFQSAVDKGKGLDAAVRSIADARPKLKHKGDEADRGCRFAVDVTMRQLDVTAQVARAGKPGREQTVAMTVVEIDGGWYLLSAPRLRDPGGASEAIDKLAGFRDQMCRCTDKSCADRVTADLTKWSAEAAKTHDVDGKPDEEETKRVAEITDQYGKCMMAAMTTDDSRTPAECEDYRALIDKVAACDKLPAATRDAFKQAFDGIDSALRSTTSSAARQSIAEGCKAASDAIRQSLSSICP